MNLKKKSPLIIAIVATFVVTLLVILISYPIPMAIFPGPKMDINFSTDRDISKFHFLRIDIDTTVRKEFMVILYLEVPGFTQSSDLSTYRPYAFKCRADTRHHTFLLPLHDFATPMDWFTEKGSTVEKIPKTNWKGLKRIVFTEYSNPLVLSRDQIMVTHLSFESSRLVFTKNVVFGAIITFLLSLSLGTFLRHEEKTKVRRTTVERYSQGEVQDIIPYLLEHYSDTELTLEKVELDLKISRTAISAEIMSKFNVSYKQYVCTLRMNKAKLLLANSSDPISEIGEKVGYSYANSFARTFKQYNDITPQEYRKLNRKTPPPSDKGSE